MHFLSAVVITYNEEKNIARCIEALQKVADEIIIIDNFSTDDTVNICKKYPVTVVQQTWLGFGPQKRAGVALAKYDNIIALDADEVPDQEAINAINELKVNGFKGVYELELHHYYFGKFLKYGQEYPNFKKRIFIKNEVNWNENKVHEALVIPEAYPVIKLKGRIDHYSYNSIAQYISKANSYTTIAAEELFAKGKKGYFLKMIFSPSFTFFKSYLFKMGLRDGMHGLVVALLNSYTNFLKYAKLWELNRREKRKL